MSRFSGFCRVPPGSQVPVFRYASIITKFNMPTFFSNNSEFYRIHFDKTISSDYDFSIFSFFELKG